MIKEVSLAIDETICIKFEGREETITIHGNGNVDYDLIVTGSQSNIFSGKSTSGYSNGGPSKLDRIYMQIGMLNESQRAGSDFRDELEKAHKAFKLEAGI